MIGRESRRENWVAEREWGMWIGKIRWALISCSEQSRDRERNESFWRLIAFVSVRLVRILYVAEHVSEVHPPVWLKWGLVWNYLGSTVSGEIWTAQFWSYRSPLVYFISQFHKNSKNLTVRISFSLFNILNFSIHEFRTQRFKTDHIPCSTYAYKSLS